MEHKADEANVLIGNYLIQLFTELY